MYKMESKAAQETKAKAMDAQGAIGKQFTSQYIPRLSPPSTHLKKKTNNHEAEGALGGAAQKVGGPLDKDGMIGKQFTTEGSLGGTVQEKMGGTKKA